jgi:hypothetical protein
MIHNPYKIHDPGKSEEENAQPDPIPEYGQQYIDGAEAARAADRPLDAIRGALALAFKQARTPQASADQNMLAGINAAQAKATELLGVCVVDEQTDLAEHVQAEIDRLAAIRDQLEGPPVEGGSGP